MYLRTILFVSLCLFSSISFGASGDKFKNLPPFKTMKPYFGQLTYCLDGKGDPNQLHTFRYDSHLKRHILLDIFGVAVEGCYVKGETYYVVTDNAPQFSIRTVFYEDSFGDIVDSESMKILKGIVFHNNKKLTSFLIVNSGFTVESKKTNNP